MPRLLWKGAIHLGLVHAPVALYPATRRDDIAFELLDRRTLAPVGYKRVNKETGEEIDKDEIVKGYEYENERYVLLSDEEIRTANAQHGHTVDILGFVETQDIPFFLFETPYYLEPAAGGEKVYALLREALSRSGKIGLAQVVVQTRRHLAALVAHGPVLILNTLRWANEVRPFDELQLPDRDVAVAGISDRELAMAGQLIDSMTEKWNPARYRDTFRDDLMALVQRKIQSGKTEAVAAMPPPVLEESASNTMDLTEVLQRSLPAGVRRKPQRRARAIQSPSRNERRPR